MGRWASRNNKERLITMTRAYSNGLYNVLSHGADRTGQEYSTAAIQAAHDAALNDAINGGNNFFAPAVVFPAGVYKIDATINHYPGIKFIAQGNVILDFTSMVTDPEDQNPKQIVAIRADTSLYTPSVSSASPGMHAAMLTPFIKGSAGTFLIIGAQGEPDSIGVDMGNGIAGPDWKGFRLTGLQNVQIEGFGTNLFLRNIDTYLLTSTNLVLKHAYKAHLEVQGTGTAINSGERITFNNFLCANRQTDTTDTILVQSPGINLNFRNSSFDYCGRSALHLKDGAQPLGYQKVTFDKCWFEACMDTAIVYSECADPSGLSVVLQNPTIVPFYNDAVHGGYDAPMDALFKGKFDLYMSNPAIQGYLNHAMNAENGLFMCDDDVNIRQWENDNFTDWEQMPAKSLNVNKNWNFDEANDGDIINYKQSIPNVLLENKGGFTNQFSNAQSFDGSGVSLELTATAPSNYFVINTDAIPLPLLKRLKVSAVMYGGTSTGDIRVQHQIRALAPHNPPVFEIESLQSVGSIAVALTNIDHEIDRYIHIGIGGADNDTYNGRFVCRGVTDLTKTPVVITSLTRSGSTVTASTATPHNLSQYEAVTTSGANEAEYNGDVVVTSTPSATTFTFEISGTPASPATGSPAYAMKPSFSYRLNASAPSPDAGTPIAKPDPFKIVLTKGNTGSDFEDLWNDVDDPDYDAGNRTIWAKERYAPQLLNNLGMGITHAYVVTTFSSWDNGDVAYCGGIPITVS